MKRLWQWIFVGLAAVSLCVFMMGLDVFLANDHAVFGSWRGTLISVDSYEDITDAKGDVANSITVRRFNPWPTKVFIHFGGGPVETGSEVPYPRGVGNSFQVWVDKVNQPIDLHDDSGHYYGPVEVTTLLQFREHNSGWLLFFILTAAMPIAWVVHAYRYFRRGARKHA